MKRKRKSVTIQAKSSLDNEENKQNKCSDTFVRNSSKPQELYSTCSITNQNLRPERENHPEQSKKKNQNYPLVPYCRSTEQKDSTSSFVETDSHSRSSRNPHISHLGDHNISHPNLFSSTLPCTKTVHYQGIIPNYIIAPDGVCYQFYSDELATQIHPYENIYSRTTYSYGTPESYAKPKEFRDGLTFIGCNCNEGNSLNNKCTKYRCMRFMNEMYPSTYKGVNLSPGTCCGHSCQRYHTPIEPFEENYHHFPLPSNCSRLYAKIIPCGMVNECFACNTSCCASMTPPLDLGRYNANYHLCSYEHTSPCEMNPCDCFYDCSKIEH